MPRELHDPFAQRKRLQQRRDELKRQLVQLTLAERTILGVSKAMIKPIHQDDTFVARLMLPLALSYDHRVIDGAGAARFTVYLAQVLADTRRLAL